MRVTNPYWPFRHLNRLPYSLCIALVRRAFGGEPGIRAVYIKHDLALYDWVPGSSDLDLCVIIESLGPDDEPQLLERFWKRYKRLHTLFPFALGYAEGAMPVASIEDLSRAGFRGAATGLGIVTTDQWRCLCGRDARERIPPLDETHVEDPANPVFHALFRSHFVFPQLADPIPEGRYLRKYHRLLTKACRFVSVHRQGDVDVFAPLLEDDATRSLPDRLAALREGNYFARDRADAEIATSELTFGFFRLVTRYYQTQTLPAQLPGVALPKRCDDAAFARASNEIGEIVATAPAGLEERCLAILCCPTAPVFSNPEAGRLSGRHEVVFVVPDDISSDSLRAVIGDLRQLHRVTDFQRRCEAHLLSESMFHAQESRLGARFAFHGAHLLRYGSVLHGANLIDSVRLPDVATLTHAVWERLAELRIRRLRFWPSGHHVGDIRKRQQRLLFELMAYRIFLAESVILTSSREILAAYLDHFEGEEMSSEVRTLLSRSPDETLTRVTVRDHARLGHGLCRAIEEDGRLRR